MFSRARPTKFLLTAFWFVYLCQINASESSQAVHGGVALVPLHDFDNVQAIEFLDNSESLLVGNFAVLAVPQFTAPGTYEVAIHHTIPQIDSSSSKKVVDQLNINVLAKQYPEEHITIADQEKVTPSQLNLDRIARESAIMKRAYARFSSQPKNLLPILQPVSGRNSGVFGSRRFFNGEPRNPHSGIDWAAPTGTPIQNPAPGEVVVTGDFFFNGNTVMVDHGGGLISMMCHLDQIDVVEGQEVQRGEILGTVGTTGRSTGPHLHWTVSVNGVRTDPAVFMKALNQLAE